MAEPKQLDDCNDIKDKYLQVEDLSKWNFRPSEAVMGCSHDMVGIRGVLDYVMSHLNPNGKSKIPLGHGDPSGFDCFRTSIDAEDALVEAIRSGKYNGYPPAVGLPQSRSSQPLEEFLTTTMAEPKQLDDCNGVKDECLQAGCTGSNKWNFRPSEAVMGCSHNMLGIRGVLDYVMSHLNPDGKSTIPLGNGDPSAFECFRTSIHVEDALIEAIRTGKYNGYSPADGLPQSRRVVADYLSRGFPYKLSEDDVYLTCGCSQAIDLALSVLAREGANILLPRPGFPQYEALMAYKGIEARHYDLVPERGWEVDLDQLDAIADSNTVAMVIINPSNPCGTVFTHDHLAKVAETAKRLGLLIISDEVYAHIVFGEKPFIPMGFFASTVPVLTLGSISKKWMVPGWRLGWLVTCDPHGILRKSQIIEGIKKLLNIVVDPSTIAQAALPQIIKKTTEDFDQQTLQLLSQAADICYDRIQKLNVLYCPAKPQGSMFVMVKINISSFVDIRDDIEFSAMLSKEESVIVLPGSPIGLKNWIRVTFAISPSVLEEGLDRITAFCMRHAKNT